jgi:Skp family chaperone for outer membrane proteins
MKIHTAAVGMLCLTALTTGACVMPSTYEKAVADLQATRVEIDSARAQSKALTEELSELQQIKINLAGRVDAASSALDLAKQRIKTERAASQGRLGKLAWAIGQLTAQQNRLRYALQRANEERPALQSVVERYKSELAEANGLRATLPPSPIAPTNEQAGAAVAPPAQVTAQADPALKPTVTAPASPAPALPNQDPQPVNRQPPEPVEDDWLSLFKGWIMSVWQSIFS